MEKDTHIVYVDDELINLQVFEINFEDKYRISTFSSGKEALEFLDNSIDIKIVISDMKMPKMNGIEFIKKAKKKYPEITFYILTGFDINDEISGALNEKLIDQYFRKPFDVKKIESTIEEKLKQ
ncbi:MAG: hypothetical protein B6I20_13665 [Bacteroidetes bacterium 4572_117]|nr:MAG: hypothetical protein B6I20_13665 [Bacteroidetes bacterium 4572_117]